MKYDIKFDLAVGVSAGSKSWKNKKYTWSEFVQRLSEEHKTPETYKEYMAFSKADQGKIKDVGGYVAGYLRGGKRGIKNVVHRQVLTLDIDFAHIDFWEDFLLQFENAAVLHSTHKHHPDSPRYRLIMPVDREMTPDEYVAIARSIAGTLDIELFDDTTFETNRLMFWPSSPQDIPYYFRFQDGPLISADDVLDSYVDWTDSSVWPISQRQSQKIRGFADKQEDPENKGGIIGAFCRTYDIHEVLEKFLPEKYTATTNGRYTYLHGSTASGLVTYEDKFAYSHHGTDPISGKLCNAFDLVRIHLFGHLDSGDSSSTSSKSFKSMQDFCRNDSEVRKIIASENITDAKYDFAEDVKIEVSEETLDWMKELEMDTRGKYLSSAPNINLIFANDIRLKGLFKQNDFDGKRYIFGNMPWRKIIKPEPIKNVDYSGVRNYIETIYGIYGNLKIDDTMALEFQKHSFHPVRDYLRGLKWDGVERVDTLLIDYFGVEDSIYTRQAIRKCLLGAVGRIMKPGIKFDYVLTLCGEQGTFKSTFVARLGQDWFSDTFMSVVGKDALEQIQGAWIIEMAELAGLRKAEVESVKHFISKQEDTFRPAYARTSETYLRQCIFIGTTNNKAFLRDATGNRRFLPVDINQIQATKNVVEDLTPEEVAQIWAEVVVAFKAGEKLYLTAAAEQIANKEQRGHSEIDERKGLILAYLDKALPKDWDKTDIYSRRTFVESGGDGVYQRDFVCIAEIWCECLGKEKEDMSRYKTKELNEIVRSLEEWQPEKGTKNFPIYGTQRFYSRKLY